MSGIAFAAVDSAAIAGAGAAPEPAWLVYVVPFATVILVAVTIWNALLVRQYTKATQRMVGEMRATRESQSEAVEEMRRAREAEVRPVLVPFVERAHPGQPEVRFGIMSVGRGPALNVDVVLHGDLVPHLLRCPVMVSGEVKLVSRPDGDPIRLDPAQIVPGEKRTLHLEGRCEDVGQRPHTVHAMAPFSDGWERRRSG